MQSLSNQIDLAKLLILTPKKTLNVNGRLVDLTSPKVMGILNVTPDSFYSASRHSDITILNAAEKMLEDGATFLDIGGYSSRPGAMDISVEEEVNRVVEPIESIAKRFPDAVISIDTFRSSVAKAAIDSGAKMINDISGGNLDTEMLPMAGKLNVPYVGMHMRGTPQTMKSFTEYDDLLTEVMSYFRQIMDRCKDVGVHDVVIDPGFGFAKTLEQNYYLLKNLPVLKQLGVPILVGVSRKSMIWKLLEVEADKALNGTTALNSVALLKGASILRVHDVKEAVEAVKLIGRLNDSGF
jgi:dihydropteroate synthase